MTFVIIIEWVVVDFIISNDDFLLQSLFENIHFPFQKILT